MDIHQRLAIFYRRLDEAPPAKNAEEAFLLICHTLEKVEAEFCPVPPRNPPPRLFDGRMYLPQLDSIEFGEDGAWWIETRRHRIAIERGGSFRICRVMGDKSLLEEFRKSALNT